MGGVRALLPLLLLLVLAAPAHAAPVSAPRSRRARGTTSASETSRAPRHRIDGSDARLDGRAPAVRGRGEVLDGALAYRDHIADAYGADNGQDADAPRRARPGRGGDARAVPARPGLPVRPGEFGVPTGPLDPRVHYGDLPHVDAADLSEVRLGTDAAATSACSPARRR